MSRVRSRALLRFGAVSTAVVLVVAGLAGSSAADPTGDQTTYLQLNLCGNVCNGGGLAIVTKLANVIANRHPHALTLNEVCENQLTRLDADLAGYEGRFDPTGPTCRNGARYGNAALLRTEVVSLVGSWSLPNLAGREPRRLMCLGGRSPEIVCVTHISTQPVDIGAQLRTVASVLSGLSSGGASVVLGGDFNVDPADDRMHPLWLVGTDVANRETFGRHRYDYMFLSCGGTPVAADATDAPDGLSDHKALWATTRALRSPVSANTPSPAARCGGN
jgi:endonuclease/exonuclease/phosphatase (EEP) superfamily protein YafD